MAAVIATAAAIIYFFAKIVPTIIYRHAKSKGVTFDKLCFNGSQFAVTNSFKTFGPVFASLFART